MEQKYNVTPVVPLDDYQSAFDYVMEKLNEQACASVDKYGSCVYRSENGAKCAIGWLISDEQYKEEMDIDAALSEIFDVSSKVHSFLRNLQNLHDRCSHQSSRQPYDPSFLNILAEEQKYFCKHYNLKPYKFG